MFEERLWGRNEVKPLGGGNQMATNPEIDQAVQEAKQLLDYHGYACAATAADLRQWYEADTPFDDNFGLDEVLRHPLLVTHELVEIDNVKRMGLSLTKDVIVTNLEKIDDAHLIATKAEDGRRVERC